MHNLASLKTEGVDVLSKLLQNRSEEVKRKILNILITHYNGKPRGQGNTKAKYEALQRNQSEARLAYNPVSELVELAKKNKSTAPKFKIISEVKEKVSSNINGIVRESEHTTHCVYECEVLSQKFRGEGNKKNLAKNNAATLAEMRVGTHYCAVTYFSQYECKTFLKEVFANISENFSCFGMIDFELSLTLNLP